MLYPLELNTEPPTIVMFFAGKYDAILVLIFVRIPLPKWQVVDTERHPSEVSDRVVFYAPLEWPETTVFLTLLSKRRKKVVPFESNANSIGAAGEDSPVMIGLFLTVGETECQQCLQLFALLVILQVVRVIRIVPL